MKLADQFPGALVDIEYHLPENILSNIALREKFPQWKVEQTEKKTGVHVRHTAAVGETAYDLSLVATRKLLTKYPGLADKIDAIIYCTQTPDYIMPSNAFLLQRDLGLRKNIMAFDYNLACSGYVYGLLMASSFIKVGIAKNLLVVTGDTYSKYLDENDRATQMLFGDGASATWVGLDAADFDAAPLFSSFDDFQFGSDGQGWDKFIVRSGGMREPLCSTPVDGYNSKIYMNGMQIVNFVNHTVAKQISELLRKHALQVEQIDQFFLHQASKLATDCITNKLKIKTGKAFSNIDVLGNTVSSSIPILIKDYFSQTSLPSGSRLLICGFGVGFSWGSMLGSK